MDALVTMRRGKNPAQRKGATLSAKNVATLKAHADQAKSIYEGLCSMVKPEMNDSDEAVATDSSATEYIGGPDPLHNPKAGEVNASLADAKLRVRTRLLLGRANSLLN